MKYEIVKIPDGGYVVGPARSWHEGNGSVAHPFPTYACSTLEDALKYIKLKLEPKQKAAS